MCLLSTGSRVRAPPGSPTFSKTYGELPHLQVGHKWGRTGAQPEFARCTCAPRLLLPPTPAGANVAPRCANGGQCGRRGYRGKVYFSRTSSRSISAAGRHGEIAGVRPSVGPVTVVGSAGRPGQACWKRTSEEVAMDGSLHGFVDAAASPGFIPAPPANVRNGRCAAK